MSLDWLWSVKKIIGAEHLRTASLIVAGFGVGSPLLLIASCFAGFSYLAISIWVLLGVHMAFSGALIYGILEDEPILMTIWLWYSILYVPIMVLLFCLLLLEHIFSAKLIRLLITLLGIVYLLVTIFSILIVNSYRVEYEKKNK